MKICGLFLCYNEEHILKESLSYYLSEGIDLVFFDNESTDSSVAIAKSFQNNNTFAGSIVDIVTIKTNGFEWTKILNQCSDYMHTHLSHYDWITIIDADSFYFSPVQDLSLREFIIEADKKNYTVLNGKFFNFYPTENELNNSESSCFKFKYYDPYDKNSNSVRQEKIFAYHPSIDFVTHKAHIIKREGKKVFPIYFHFRHYGWISFEQGYKKVFKERKSRYISSELRNAHPPYNNLLPIKSDFVRKPDGLKKFSNSRDYFSKTSFKLALFCLPIYSLINRIDRMRRKHVVKKLLIIKGLANYDSIKAFVHYVRFMRQDKKNQSRWKKIYPHQFPQQNTYSWGPVDTAVYTLQKSDAAGVPFSPFVYHFLIKDACNAHCTFCNQKHFSNKELSFDQFKTITNNIPRAAMRTFIFSGGGEPLICSDLKKMIAYTKNQFPWVSIGIRTNGFNLHKHIDTLCENPIDFLEISWHAATAEESKKIYRCNGFEKRINAIKTLKNDLDIKKCKTKISFCIVGSQVNIESVPDIIRLAVQLNIFNVDVSFCRYYTEKNKNNHQPETPPDQFQQSLFFAQKKYNKYIKQSIKLAKKLGVNLTHEPLFKKPHMRIYCRHPWKTMLIDHNGMVYPCPGGEARFAEKVDSGEYFFGNLLKQHLYECLAETAYTKLRRTLNKTTNEQFIPECHSCCMTTHFCGADKKSGHLIG